MHAHKRLSRIQRWAMVMTAGTSCAIIGDCNLGEVTATTTLDGREVVTSLLKGALITPLETVINEGVDRFFDQVAGENED